MLLDGTSVPPSVADTPQVVAAGNVAGAQVTVSTGTGAAVTVADPDPEAVPTLPSTVADTLT